MKNEKLQEVLAEHKKWLESGGKEGKRADLRWADLRGADLRGANIDGEIIQRPPISIANITYWCLITDDRMRLGCKLHTHNEWQNFNDGEISAMDDDALDFWKTWKEPLLAMCAAHRSKL